ncbi:autoinducer binding domain-containing protein [Vannielia litorea]|uniref:autoinducer binding domain-containing protein n=1 Tax=Vannielia TaxID=2813041 RepID=UPI001C96C8CD|nr:autoinducer binding domain-containing protein [Vannielia litorea]MBY6049657.1 autoinducer binding domain-containing protein [Vannielia litorea]MBY6077071.1 autoinducer binding domain-containing protein [Vannielia litorea]MBY6155685.1 autoinducer binding domain-containing protein [Vannielia litorea]
MSDKQRIDRELEALGKLAPAGYFAGLHIRFASPLHVFQTYDKAWNDHYTAQAYAMRDPMIAWGFSTEGETRWSEIELPDPFGILDEAAEFGLKFGMQVSCGPISSRTIAGAARADREFEADEMAAIGDIIRKLHDLTEPPESLTQAQIDALRLIAAGDRHTAAAAKLNISESALKARLTAARERLHARTTAEALQRAKEYRLL